MKILILSEDENFSDFLCDVVEEKGRPTILSGISSTIATIKKVCFDLIIIDSIVEEVLGFELYEDLKSISPNSKFIIFSDNQIKSDGEKGFVSKPFSITDFLKLVGV